MRLPPVIRRLMPPALYLRAVALHDYWRGEPELRLLRYLVKPSLPAVDAGVNYGVYSFFLSRLTAQVYAFEPHPELAVFIRRSASRRVRLFECALSDATGSAELHIPLEHEREVHGMGTLGSGLQATTTRSITVRTEVLDRLELGPVGFMKIDVEGHEMAVLRGARTTLCNHRPRLLIEMERRHTGGALAPGFAWLQDLGYQGWFYFSGRLYPLSAFVPEQHQPDPAAAATAGGYAQNFIFIHQQDPVTLPSSLP